MSRSVNDIVYEVTWRELHSLSDKQKICALLKRNILTQNDVEDGLFKSTDLTDWCYDAGLTADEIEQL